MNKQVSLGINALEKDLIGIRTPSSMKLAKFASKRGSINDEVRIRQSMKPKVDLNVINLNEGFKVKDIKGYQTPKT